MIRDFVCARVLWVEGQAGKLSSWLHVSVTTKRQTASPTRAVCGVAQIYLCFCTQETARLKRASSLSLMCHRTPLHGEGQSNHLWGDAAQWEHLNKCRSPGKHHISLEGVAWVFQAGSKGRRNASQLQGCIGGLKKPLRLPTPCTASNCYNAFCLGWVQSLGLTFGMDFHMDKRHKCNILKVEH